PCSAIDRQHAACTPHGARPVAFECLPVYPARGAVACRDGVRVFSGHRPPRSYAAHLLWRHWTMIKRELCARIADAIRRAQDAGALPPVALPEITLEPPRKEEWGDYACSIALKIQRSTGLKPMDIAHAIIAHLALEPEVAEAEVAQPGFINLHLKP